MWEKLTEYGALMAVLAYIAKALWDRDIARQKEIAELHKSYGCQLRDLRESHAQEVALVNKAAINALQDQSAQLLRAFELGQCARPMILEEGKHNEDHENQKEPTCDPDATGCGTR